MSNGNGVTATISNAMESVSEKAQEIAAGAKSAVENAATAVKKKAAAAKKSTVAPLMSRTKLESLVSKQPVTSLDGVLEQVRKSLGCPQPSK